MPDYKKAARRAAIRHGIDPDIFVAQLRQESGLVPGKTSSAGAQGIAQFIPTTAKAYGVNLQDGRVGDDLNGAARYMRDNLKKYGTYERALSAYNSGRPDAYKDPNFADGQTYNYVKSILGSVGEKPVAHAERKTVRPAKATVPSVDRRAALIGYLENRHHPSALLGLAEALKAPEAPVSRRVSVSPSQAANTSPSRLRELFYQGPGGIDVKNGQVEPQGFVSGHTDHVHVASGPKTIVDLAELAQRMGLHVGENPHYGGVHPVHVKGSYHYKGQAIDVSGPPELMRRYAKTVAKKFGVR